MLSISNIRFQYPVGAFRLEVPELQVVAGEALAVIGPSGSGKTTLLNLIAGILKPASGRIATAGAELASLDDTQLRDLRLTRLGLVFQEFELLEYLDVLNNILLPFRLSRALVLTKNVRETAALLAERVGIGDKLASYPERLSQGERQRVALCRALITNPGMILADEPTGNLDPANKGIALDFLFDYVREHNAALVTVTHDHQLVERFDRVLDFQAFLPGQRGVDAGAAA
jgi:putative ABC transport system ATP-binding protein